MDLRDPFFSYVLALALLILLVSLGGVWGCWRLHLLLQQLDSQQPRLALIQYKESLLLKQESQLAQYQGRNEKRESPSLLKLYMGITERRQHLTHLAQKHELRWMALPTQDPQLDTPELARLSLRLSGSFHELLSYLYALEREEALAQVESVKMEMQSSYSMSGQKREGLSMKLRLQAIQLNVSQPQKSNK